LIHTLLIHWRSPLSTKEVCGRGVLRSSPIRRARSPDNE
jgi:hypothetical protein